MKFLIAFILLSTIIFSQSVANNFSQRRFGGNPYYNSLGYSGFASASKNHINVVNPSSWIFVPNTIFDISMRSVSQERKISNLSFNSSITNLEGVNWLSNIKDTTIAIGFNISPVEDRYGNVSYNYSSTVLDGDVNLNYIENIKYQGTLNQFKLASAFRLKENLSISVAGLYYYGSFIEETKREFTGGNFVKYNSELSKKFTGYNFELSAFYKLNPRTNVSLLYSPSKELEKEARVLVVRQLVDNQSFNFNPNESYKVPQKIIFGLSHNLTKRNILYFDYQYESWTNKAQNLNKLSVGMEFIGKKDIFESIFKRSNYMFGMYYYTDIYEKDKLFYGINAGISIPFNFDRNRLLLSVGYGKRHDKLSFSGGFSSFQLNVGLSLSEFWYLPESED